MNKEKIKEELGKKTFWDWGNYSFRAKTARFSAQIVNGYGIMYIMNTQLWDRLSFLNVLKDIFNE